MNNETNDGAAVEVGECETVTHEILACERVFQLLQETGTSCSTGSKLLWISLIFGKKHGVEHDLHHFGLKVGNSPIRPLIDQGLPENIAWNKFRLVLGGEIAVDGHGFEETNVAVNEIGNLSSREYSFELGASCRIAKVYVFGFVGHADFFEHPVTTSGARHERTVEFDHVASIETSEEQRQWIWRDCGDG